MTYLPFPFPEDSPWFVNVDDEMFGFDPSAGASGDEPLWLDEYDDWHPEEQAHAAAMAMAEIARQPCGVHEEGFDKPRDAYRAARKRMEIDPQDEEASK